MPGAASTVEYAVHCDPGGPGALRLTGGAVVFAPDDAAVEGWSAALRVLQDVRVAKAAPKMKVRLPEEVLGRGRSGALSVTLKFNAAAERDAFAAAATAQKRGLREADVAGVPPLEKGEAAKAAVLSAHAELRHLHRVVVVEKGWVTDAAFWEQRAHLLEAAPQLAVRSAHFSRELLAERSGDGQQYRLNRQLIHDVFSEYPAVEAAYRSHVVASGMDEREFWSQFLTSAYFRTREARGAVRAERANIFDGLLGREAAAPAGGDAAPPVPRALALDAPAAKEGFGYGTRRPTEWLASAATMALADAEAVSPAEEIGTRFSRHSVLVLKTAEGRQPAVSTVAAAAHGACEVDPAADRETQDVFSAAAPTAAGKRSRDDTGGGPATAAAAAAPRLARTPLPSIPPHKVRRLWKPGGGDPATARGGAQTGHGLKVADWLLREHQRAGKAAAAGEGRARAAPPADVEFQRTQRVVLEVLAQYWRGAAPREELGKHLGDLHDEMDKAVARRRDDNVLTAGYRGLQELLNKALAAGQGRTGGWQVK
eukprot:TRINITY_DN6169_c0_g2_i1.p1 TRINITY_DN6169_c0_g2~~TRINITY_DN6169_c0_g2_i1.p1  ORF type:complete len:556 (+),score=205.16 TRINITY_DN6169_c0_g2_i1:50-1669(+)